MKTIHLEILAEDVLNFDYGYAKTCPITQALQRAGYNYKDSGLQIEDEIGEPIVERGNESYDNLVKTVLGMYYTKTEDEGYLFSNIGTVYPQPLENVKIILEFD